MTFDLFAPLISDEEIATFESRKLAYKLTGTVLGDLVIIPNETSRKFPGEVRYTPREIRYLLSLSDEEAKKVHKMKKAFGGHVKESGL
jgi:hypothetical protein